MKKIINADQINARIAEMAAEIDDYYGCQQEPIVVIGVLAGAMFFMADLIRRMNSRVKIDFIRVSTYPGKMTTAQKPKIIAEPTTSLFSAHILLVDDILDTGITLKAVKEELLWSCPDDMKTAVLLRKPGKVTNGTFADFIGFDVPDEFLIGYGLDFDGRYRELPYIAIGDENEFRTGKKEASRSK